MVICLEDAIREDEIIEWLGNIQKLLLTMKQKNVKEWLLIFLRPRTPSMAIELFKMEWIENINGYVLPKFDNISFSLWYEVILKSPLNFVFMPTLETHNIIDEKWAKKLSNKILKNNIKQRILVLRIGGNDLLSCFRLRRNSDSTIYDSPLIYVISMLMSVFVPQWFYFSSPVCESIKENAMLKKELEKDVSFWFTGKTAIHPNQVDMIHNAFQITQNDLESALKIVDVQAKAVFQHNGNMCEPSTHYNWAREILERKKWYGVKDTW